MHPGDHVRPGDALEQVPGVGNGNGTDEQPPRPVDLLTTQHSRSAI